MPARVKATIHQRAGASDSEDDLATANAIEDHSPNAAAGSKLLENKLATMTKATARRASTGKAAPKRKAVSARPRQALKDRTNIPNGSDTEEVDNFDEEDHAKPSNKRAKTATTAKRKPRVARATSEPVEDARPAPLAQRATSGSARGRQTKRVQQEVLQVIPETQQAPFQDDQIEQSIEIDDIMDIAAVPTPPRAKAFVQRARSASIQPLQPRASVRSVSAQPGYPSPRERSGSVSGTERRGGDPEMRRQLNDMTKKYDNLNLKYQNLQEVGRGSADTNFEKLKRASDRKAKDADELVNSLKKELAELRKASSSGNTESIILQKEVSTLKATNAKLSDETKSLKESLQASANEVKSLDARLIAARQQISNSATQEQASKIPSSAIQNFNKAVSSNATDAQKEAKMKENLYSDLTGLIIRGVKRTDGEDVYDCIQTGRNGTLHFHLSIANDSSTSNPKTPSGLSYEEAEFAYEPLLDESRDRELIDMLPDYLTEEICFPRNHAVKFYSRVVDSMTKKIVLEE